MISRPVVVTPLSTVSNHPLLNQSMALGGTPAVNCHAAVDALKRALTFLGKVASAG